MVDSFGVYNVIDETLDALICRFLHPNTVC